MNTSVSSNTSSRWLGRSVPVIVLLAGGWWMLRGHADTPPAAVKQTPVMATLAKVLRQDVPDELIGVGNVQALASVTVKTQIDGKLESVNYNEGQDVRAGQLLAQIDSRALRAQLEQTQAQKARDVAQLANAKLDLARYERLIKEDATTQQTLDTQRALTTQLQAAVQTDDAQIHYAQVQLSYTTITAPLSGRVGARLVDPGNIVHAADAGGLLVINQVDPISVVFTLPGDAVPAINGVQTPKQPLQVTVRERESNALLATGQLVLVNNQIDTTNGTVQLKAHFANPKHQLWPGQYVNARLQLGILKQALTVPAPAVQRSQSGTYVYVIGADKQAELRPVQVQQIQDNVAVIAKGLAEGETVVTDGQYKIKPGSVVVAASGGSAQ